jgi:uncharacterized protein DUF6545
VGQETVRWVLIVLVWLALLLRIPAVIADRRQLPISIVLSFLAFGSITIQSWFGRAVNDFTGIAEFNNLIQGLSGIASQAVLLEFIILTYRSSASANRLSVLRISLACAVASLMSMCFALTEPAARFHTPTATMFIGYALVAASYMIANAIAIVILAIRRLLSIRSAVLFAALTMVMVGNLIQVPFMLIRTVERLTPGIPDRLAQIAFPLGTARFILTTFGCVLTALVPIAANVRHLYHWRRLRRMWLLLTAATNELAIERTDRSILRLGDGWKLLHSRIIDIRDSCFYLYDRRATPALLDEAHRYAYGATLSKHQDLVVAACWLEVTRRLALTNHSTANIVADRTLSSLPPVVRDPANLASEARTMLSLYKMMSSPAVQCFVAKHQAGLTT